MHEYDEIFLLKTNQYVYYLTRNNFILFFVHVYTTKLFVLIP